MFPSDQNPNNSTPVELFSPQNSDSAPNNENIKNSNAQDKEALILYTERAIQIRTEKAKVQFDDLIGLEKPKSDLKEYLIAPYLNLQNAQRAQSYGAKGMLLYGPSGCGKTSLIQACAHVMNAKFYVLQLKDFCQTFKSPPHRFLKEIFRTAIDNHPACIVLEDIDKICPSHPIINEIENENIRRIKTEFLVQMMNGYACPQLFIIATTQVPWRLDSAVRRRLEIRIPVFPPDEPTRASLLTQKLLHFENGFLGPEEISALSQLTEGFSYKDIVELVRLAAYERIRELQKAKYFKVSKEGDQRYEACSSDDPEAKEMSLLEIPYENIKPRKITMEDFQNVIHKISSNTAETMHQHQRFLVDFGEG